MEKDENIVAPEEEKVIETPEVVEGDEEVTPTIEEPEVVENAKEDDDEDDDDIEEPDFEDRLNALEGNMEEFNNRFDQLSTEQEKIVNVLEKISDKILTAPQTPIKAEEKNALKEGDFGGAVKGEEPESEDAPQAEETATEPVEEAQEEIVDEPTNEVAEEPATEETEEQTESVPEEKPAEEKKAKRKTKKENEMTKEELQEILNSFKADVVNEILDAKVEEPEVKEVEEEEETKTENPEIAQNWRQRYNDQVAAAWDFHRLNNIEAGKKLQAINQYNADLKVKNDAGTAPMTITSLAEFVLPPEMDREIHGMRTNYTPFLNTINYQQTTSLQFMYSTRVGDINMQNVAFCHDGADGNLKPVETYQLEKGIARMEEMAAVTPICDNATKYMAVDILQDVAAGYRNDYDRKLAQLAIVRFQQAVNATGNTVEYNPATAVDSLVDFVKATTLVSDGVVNGKFIFNARTKALILENLLRSGNDGLGEKAFTTGNTQTIWGYDYIVVPNDLLPTLGTTETRQFKALDNATGVLETVDITSPVFYGDFDVYRGKVNGGLNYTISTDASYEIGGVVYSAYQRNEMVIRGSFYRGGYIADKEVIAGLAPVTSS